MIAPKKVRTMPFLAILACAMGLYSCSPADQHISPQENDIVETTIGSKSIAELEISEDFIPTRFTVEVFPENNKDVEQSRPQIILLPGLASSSDVWKATRDQLSTTHEVHVLSVNGFAGSPSGTNAEAGSLFEIADEVSLYAKSLRNPQIIGHSMGGLVALMVANSDQSPVSKVMAVDVLPFFSVLINPMATSKNMVSAAEKARDGMLAQSEQEFADSQNLAMKRLTVSEENAAITAQWSISSDKVAVANIMYDVMLTDLRKEIANIQVPVVVVYAFDEGVGFPKAAVSGAYKMNYAALKHVELRMIEDARHYLMLDQPEAFSEEVDRFINNSNYLE